MSEVNFTPLGDLLAALKTRLEAIPHPVLASPAKLFERVDFHENKKLGEAMQALLIFKGRVCLIVPSGEFYRTARDGRAIVVERDFEFDLLVCDRAYTKGGHDAVFGGAANLGCLRMAELARDALLEDPTLGLPGFTAIAPTDSALITIDDDKKDSPGRECWVLAWETPAGEARSSVND